MSSKKWSCKKWTVNELNAFNICINTVDTRAFFSYLDLPSPAISPESIILNHVNRPAGLELSNDDNCFFLFLLHPTFSKGHDFAGQVLTMMGFELLNGLIMSQQLPLPFIIFLILDPFSCTLGHITPRSTSLLIQISESTCVILVSSFLFIMKDWWLTATPTFLLQDRQNYICLFVETESVSFPSLALWLHFPDSYKASLRQRRALASGLCSRSIYLR